MRFSFTMVGAAVVAAVGVAGLIRGAEPATSSGSSSSSSSQMDMSMDGSAAGSASGSASASASGSTKAPVGGSAGQGGPIVITAAYVQEPAQPDTIAAYFSLENTTGTADRLTSVDSGAGAVTTLHTGSSMTAAPNGLALPAHKTVSLSVGNGHVMIEQPYGAVTPGQTVNLVLHFQNAPQLTVAAPVIAIGAPVPESGG